MKRTRFKLSWKKQRSLAKVRTAAEVKNMKRKQFMVKTRVKCNYVCRVGDDEARAASLEYSGGTPKLIEGSKCVEVMEMLGLVINSRFLHRKQLRRHVGKGSFVLQKPC